MKSTTILIAAFASLAVASPEAINHLLRARQSDTTCDEPGYLKCASPYVPGITGSCGQDQDCICKAVRGLVGCANNFCPRILTSDARQAFTVCGIGSGGSSGGSTGGDSSGIESDISVIEPTATGLDKPTATDDGFFTETNDDSGGPTATDDGPPTETSTDESGNDLNNDDVSSVVVTKTSNRGPEATGTAGGGNGGSGPGDGSSDEAGATTTVEEDAPSATRSRAPQPTTGAAEALKAPAAMLVGALGVAALF